MTFYTNWKRPFHACMKAAGRTCGTRHRPAPEHVYSTLKTLVNTMKLTTIMLLAFCLHLSAKSVSQTVTFTGRNVSLSAALDAVKKQTGYVFFYNSNTIRSSKPLSIQAVNQPLQVFLDNILREQELAYSIEDRVIIITRKPATPAGSTVAIPAATIKGRITDDRGNPLPGVSIKVKGGSRGTTTDADGFFTLSGLDEDAVLEISFIGFTSKEVSIKGKTTLDLQLAPSSQDIEAVTVVGYTSKNVKYLSSAVSTVSGERLRDVTSNNLSDLLQGKAAGVVVSSASGDPTSGAAMLIRGQNTLAAGSAPLYVVDGNIGGTFNPNDVESVSILKDAAATGLYGSRAANGVVIITTRQGKAGKSRIEFNSATGFNKANFGKFRLMNAQQLYDYQNTFTTRPESVLETDTDWLDLAFRTAMTQNYSLSASGGSDKTQFYVGGNYYNEEGTLLTNRKKAYSFRTNISHRLTEKLKVSVLLNGIFTNNDNHQSSTLYDAFVNLPWDNPYNADGSPRPGNSAGWLGRDQHNFLHSLQYNLASNRRFEVTGDLNLDYTIVKNLTFSSYNRTYFSNYKSMDYYDLRSQEGVADKGNLFHDIEYGNRLLSSNRLRYENNFGEHHLSALAVGETEKYYFDNNEISGRGLPQGMTAMSTATEVKNNPSGGRDEYAFSKWLVQGDYDFANKYFLVASFVRDISSKFGNNNPGGNFYQVGASWILSNEHFIPSTSAISFLKLRLSHGTVGNAPSGNYQALGLYIYDQSASYAGLAGSYPSQKANPDLTWEKIRVNNAGLDISFFQNRIALNVDVYDKSAKSLLMTRLLPLTSGYTSVLENIGSVNNKGIEVSLHTQNLTGAFKWETNFNIAHNRNRVTKLNGSDQFANAGNIQPVGLGHDMDKWYMRIWAGVNPENGDPQWEKIETDADGKQIVTYTNSYNQATLQYTGTSSAPKLTGGLLNTFSYKGFTLSAFINFVSGNQVFNSFRQFFDSDGLYDSYNQMVLADGWNRWEKAGDIATHPKPLLGGNRASNEPSSRFLEDGSYIRLRNVRLSYDLPQDLLGRVKIGSARVFVSGDNLWTGTSFSGMDPEVDFSSGVSGNKYPISRKILFGVNIGF
ncbi:TonB-dependent receptor [Chitinophaga sp. XS-30]|nr:TonB-dependent receptor [Chitinophaga sp. XS-30]